MAIQVQRDRKALVGLERTLPDGLTQHGIFRMLVTLTLERRKFGQLMIRPNSSSTLNTRLLKRKLPFLRHGLWSVHDGLL